MRRWNSVDFGGEWRRCGTFIFIERFVFGQGLSGVSSKRKNVLVEEDIMGYNNLVGVEIVDLVIIVVIHKTQ